MRLMRFIKFIMNEIFPGGRLPSVDRGRGARHEGGLPDQPGAVAAPALRQDPRPVGGSAARRRDEAIAIQSEEVYDRYMKYLTGCADLFRAGYTDVCQFTLEKG